MRASASAVSLARIFIKKRFSTHSIYGSLEFNLEVSPQQLRLLSEEVNFLLFEFDEVSSLIELPVSLKRSNESEIIRCSLLECKV